MNSDLFAGKNANNQSVFSWVSKTPVENFRADITPFFLNILNMPNKPTLHVDPPAFTDFLGYVGFGTQAFNSIGNVTFEVSRLSIDIEK
jgi:hypothetical protein